MQHAVIARVYGIVQGVGFRPSVDRLAGRHGIKGSVCNKGPYVEIDAQGELSDIDAFLDDLRHNPPERAIILKLDREDAPQNIGKDDHFSSILRTGDICIHSSIVLRAARGRRSLTTCLMTGSAQACLNSRCALSANTNTPMPRPDRNG